MAKNNKNTNDTIRALDNDIDETLYGITDEERESKELIKNLQAKINNLNKYENIKTSSNLLEFITNALYENNKERKYNNETNFEKIKNNISSNNKSINEFINGNIGQQMLGEEKERIESYLDYRIADAFIPQISRAINLYRDCTLSPDDIKKSSLNINLENNSNEAVQEEFSENIKFLKKTYKLDKKAKNWVREGYLLGDAFVAVLKFDNEINKILLHENQNYLPKKEIVLTENEIFNDFSILENDIYKKILLDEEMNELLKSEVNKLNKENKKSFKSSDLKKVKGFKNYEFKDFQSEITEKINNNIIIETDKKKKTLSSQLYLQEKEEKNKNFKPIKMPGAIIRDLLPENTIKLEIDGICFGYLYIEKYGLTDNNSNSFSVTASQLLSSSNSSSYSSVNGTTISSSNKTVSYFDTFKNSSIESQPTKQRFLTDLFVKGISKKINKKFIEDNPQFKEIIYLLLKNDYMINKKIKITFYEPEEVFHLKMDSNGTYGSSKLSKVMYYVKILLANITTEAMQKVSRGRDKRVIYVETGLDDDIEGSIEGVIKDFKAKEFQIDNFKNVSSVLKQVGIFDDYYIPKIDGEVPLEIETLSGMDVGSDNEFNEYIQKSIMTGMGLPNTYVDASNDIDFSRSLVMQNNPFVREIVGEQGDVSETFLTPLISRLYECEFPDLVINQKINAFYNIDNKEKIEDLERKRKERKKSKEISEKDSSEGDTETSNEMEKLDNINSNSPEDKARQIDTEDIIVTLPTPQYLNISIISETISNNQTRIDFVTNTLFDENSTDEEENKKKQMFKRDYTKKLVTDIDWEEVDEVYEEVIRKINKEKLDKESENPDNSETEDDFGSDDDLGY